MSWIQTLEGSKFDFYAPAASAINPDTLCKVLSRICRFGGHCKAFYSVSQHSLLVCDLVASPALKLAALLHDAHEVYTGFGDVCRPAKQYAAEQGFSLKAHEQRIDEAIAERFGFDPALFRIDSIKQADNIALATEQRDIMATPPEAWTFCAEPSPVVFIDPVDEQQAFRMFSSRLYELWSG